MTQRYVKTDCPHIKNISKDKAYPVIDVMGPLVKIENDQGDGCWMPENWISSCDCSGWHWCDKDGNSIGENE